MKALVLTNCGSVDNLRVTDVAEPVADASSVSVRVNVSGVNFADLHVIEGTYDFLPLSQYVPGLEVVGTDGLGRRIVGLVRNGGWAERVVVPESSVAVLPDFVSDDDGIALALQGFSAWHLLRTVTRISREDTVAVFAAAGGVGTIAVQLARAWGARRVIAVASTSTKRELALSLGADSSVDSNSSDLTSALIDANGGRAIDVILEMTGGSTLDASLKALAPFGRMAVYGSVSSAQSTPVRLESLMQDSRTVVGFRSGGLISRRPHVVAETCAGLFGMLKKGELRPQIGSAVTLDGVPGALRLMGDRKSTGKTIVRIAE